MPYTLDENLILNNAHKLKALSPKASRGVRPSYLRDLPYTLSVDTETRGLDWFDNDTAFLATMSDYDNDWVFQESELHKLREPMLAADAIIFHNATFDLNVLIRAGVFTLEECMALPIHDTDLLARIVLSHRFLFGLKALSVDLLSKDCGDAELAVKQCMVDLHLIRSVETRESPPGAYFKVWQAYPHILEEYARLDTRYTHDLFWVLMSMATEHNLNAYRDELAALPYVLAMENIGVRVDQSKVEPLKLGYEERHAALTHEIEKHNDYEPINPGSSNDVIALLLKHGIVIEERTEKDNPKTDKGTLEKYVNEPVVEAILDWRNVDKFLSTYIGPMDGRDIVHTNFRQIGARTQRMSASRPNMQNVPVRGGSELREMFVPREGHCFVVTDYSSIELRVLAWYMNDKKLWEWIESGDPFLKVGEVAFATADMSEWPVGRSPLKNATYAILYGVGADKLARTVGGGMTRAEALKLREQITRALGPAYSNPFYPPIERPGHKLDWSRGRWYPGMPDGFVQRARKAITKGPGYVRGYGDRVIVIDDPEFAYRAPNYIIQTSAATIMKRGIVNVGAAVWPLGARPLLVVHDELVTEVPLGKEQEVLAIQEEQMVAAGGPISLKVASTICYNSYAEAKG